MEIMTAVRPAVRPNSSLTASSIAHSPARYVNETTRARQRDTKLQTSKSTKYKDRCVGGGGAGNNNNNNNNKEAEKILKYKDLTIEIQRMWNVKTKVIPVTIGATGTISKTFRKYVSNIPGNHEVKELQKTAILGTAHILRKVLM